MYLPASEPEPSYEPQERESTCVRCGVKVYDEASFCQLCDFALYKRSAVERNVWRLIGELSAHRVECSDGRLSCNCSGIGEAGRCAAANLLQELRKLEWRWEGKKRVAEQGELVFHVEPPELEDEPSYRLTVRFKGEAWGYNNEHKLPIWFWEL